VEARLAAVEAQAAQRTSYDDEMARNMGEEICAMGSQINTLNNRISKITNRPAVRIEHITALEERVIALDKSLSELRCEYLEGCLRSHQMEELLIALHSNMRDIRAAHTESKQPNSSEASTVEASARKQRSSHHNVSSIEVAGGAKNRQARLETISEVPVDETPEEASPEFHDRPDIREGHVKEEPSHSPETVASDTSACTALELGCGEDSLGNIDKAHVDLLAPELAIEPHTPEDGMKEDSNFCGNVGPVL